jgi:TolB-like protein
MNDHRDNHASLEPTADVSRPVRFGTIELDLRARELRRQGRRIRLQEQPCLILAALLERPGEVVTREELCRKLWPGHTFVDFDHSLNTAVMRLRASLRNSCTGGDFVETVPRSGYRFVGEIQDTSALTVTSQLRAMMVVPLKALSAMQEESYFAEGLTDELSTRLTQVNAFRVVSRDMVRKCTERASSLAAARELKVDAFLEGSVRVFGNRIRITLELLDVCSERHIWAETYDRHLDLGKGLESEIANAVVAQLREQLAPESVRPSRGFERIGPDVYYECLKGRFHWSQRSEESLTKAITYFQSAATRNPQCASAYAGLADCHIMRSVNFEIWPAEQAVPKARSAAFKALSIDPNLAEALTSLATVHFSHDWDWESAEKEFLRAIHLDPGNAMTYQRYSLYLGALGNVNECVAQIKRARRLDPLSISINFSVGRRFYMARDYDHAIEQLRNTLEMEPNYELARCLLGQAYERNGDHGLAIAELKRAKRDSQNSSLALAALGQAYAVSGQKPRAERCLTELLMRSRERYVSQFQIAMLRLALGQRDEAMDCLEAAYRERSTALVFMNAEPRLDDLRSDRRFRNLKERVGLPN